MLRMRNGNLFRHEELCERSFYKTVIYKMSWQRLNLDGLQMTESKFA